MFIVVRFGADDEELFNPDCASRVLIENMKKRCDCMERETIALIDEKGNLVPINGKSMENAASIFRDRAVYTLLAVEKKNDVVTYVPLVDDAGKDLLALLDQLSQGKNAIKKFKRHTQGKSQQSSRHGASTPVNKTRK